MKELLNLLSTFRGKDHGREVAKLIDEFQNDGRYEVKFDANNLASGIYIYRLEANDFVDSKKMMLVK